MSIFRKKPRPPTGNSTSFGEYRIALFGDGLYKVQVSRPYVSYGDGTHLVHWVFLGLSASTLEGAQVQLENHRAEVDRQKKATTIIKVWDQP